MDEGLDVAEAAAQRVLALPRLAPILATYATSGLALSAVLRSDAEGAETLHEALKGQRGTASFFCPFTMDRLLGLLAVTSGHIDAALGHFEDGLAFSERARFRPQYAWTACDYVEALTLRSDPGDLSRATALRQEALSLARELEMRPLIERLSRG